MIGPIISSGIISQAWDNIFAVLIGMGFGFALESSGFSSSRKIIGTFLATILWLSKCSLLLPLSLQWVYFI